MVLSWKTTSLAVQALEAAVNFHVLIGTFAVVAFVKLLLLKSNFYLLLVELK